jgi:hypothetical protein
MVLDYSIVCGLFKDAASRSGYTQRRMIGWLINNELEKDWKEAFMVLFRNLPRGTEENHEKPQDSLSPGRELNSGPPK